MRSITPGSTTRWWYRQPVTPAAVTWFKRPGAANHGLGVAATDTDNSRASFSTFGNWIKIAAPGVNVLSTAPTYNTPLGVLNYAYLSGTSMATPHVAAVAGLVYMANPNLSGGGGGPAAAAGGTGDLRMPGGINSSDMEC